MLRRLLPMFGLIAATLCLALLAQVELCAAPYSASQQVEPARLSEIDLEIELEAHLAMVEPVSGIAPASCCTGMGCKGGKGCCCGGWCSPYNSGFYPNYGDCACQGTCCCMTTMYPRWMYAYAGGNGLYGEGGCRPFRDPYSPDLFYNYYAPQTPCGGVPTDMYLCPHDTPRPTVPTYYTYQPWLPHEMLYTHRRHYLRYYNEGQGYTKTTVQWHAGITRRVGERGLRGIWPCQW